MEAPAHRLDSANTVTRCHHCKGIVGGTFVAPSQRPKADGRRCGH